LLNNLSATQKTLLLNQLNPVAAMLF